MRRGWFDEIFAGLSQLAPGSTPSTRRALTLAGGGLELRRILDLGCGAGRSTLALAAATDARIDAVDLGQGYLDALTAEAVRAGLAHRITTHCADMADPPVPPGAFDLIWAEGAIYVIGVERGLRAWGPLLAPGGRIAFTELCWLDRAGAGVAEAFWSAAYPPMADIAATEGRIADAGFRVIDRFPLPPEDWAAYYGPLAASLDAFCVRHAGDADALAVAVGVRREIEVHKAAPGAYSYVFFVVEPA